jgi:hypothetical protein
MAWRLAGKYFGYCDCKQVCPCAFDGPPTGADGQCHGGLVYSVREGNLDDVDLSGMTYALAYHAPSNISAGNLTLGLVVDEGASDEQAGAIERIWRGQEGGPMADITALVGEFRGVERGSVTVSDGDSPKVAVDGSEIGIEPFRGGDGNETTVSNSMFGFAPTFTLAQASGQGNLFGESFDANYGEIAEFEDSSEG